MRARWQFAVPGILVAAWAALASGAEDDFAQRAAAAALTERGFYESGGGPDAAALAQAPLVTRPPDHIAEADRKVAEREAARRAAERAAEESAVARLVEQLATSRVQHGAQLRDLAAQRTDLARRLEAARSSGTASETRTLTGQLAAVDEALVRKQEEVARYEARLATEIVKAQAAPRAAEEARRVAEARELASRLRTKEAQIEAGQTAFGTQLATLDAAIAQAERNGLEDVARQFRTDREKTSDAQQAFLANQEATRATFRRDLDRAYAVNRADGIGPTSTVALASALRRTAVASGQDPIAATDLIDRDALAATGASAARVASGAPASTTHVSIFNDVTSEALRDFALDYAAEARVTYGSWEGFKGRVLEGYVAGVGTGTIDAVKGLVEVVVGLADLSGEALEDAVERLTGAELDVFGDEKMRVVRDLMESGARLYGDDVQASTEELRKLLATAEAIQTLARRKTEQLAGSGEKGIREAINIVGQAAPQVLSAEELAVRGGAAAARVAGRGARILSSADKVDTVTDAVRVGEAAVGARAASADGVSSPLPASADETPTALSGARDPAPARPATGQPPPVRAPPLQAEAVLVRPDGSATLRLADGREFPLGKEIGRGSTTTVYEVPGRDGLVVKVTTGGADALDDAGYRVLKGLDPHGEIIEVPTVHRTYEGTAIRSIDGAQTGVVTVADKAPTDFKRATDIHKPGGGMTPGQIDAYRRAMDKLNDQGFVWLDSKNDNYTFRRVSGAEGDEWKLVILDPGGIVPMKGRDTDAARALQRAIDTPSERARSTSRQFDQHRLRHMEELAERFDDLVDWEAIRRLTGKDYRTLGKDYEDYSEVFPFNPKNGFDYPELSAALDGPAARPLTGARVPVDRDAPTQLDSSASSVAPEPVAAGAPAIATASRTDDVPPVRTPGAGLLVDDSVPLAAGAAGATSALVLGGGFALHQVLQPIYFEFGGDGPPPVPPVSGLGRFLRGGHFLVEVEQVYHVTGNNPFDPRDPLAEDAARTGGVSEPPTRPRPPGTPRPPPTPGPGPGPAPAPSNPFAGAVGSYSGNNGCGVGSSSFATQGVDAIRLTIAPNGGVIFDLVPGTDQARSRSNNLVIFGSPGHSCDVRDIQDRSFQLQCSNTGGGFCAENFNR